MKYESGIKNLRQSMARFSRGQKIVAGLMIFVVSVTWLAVCALLVSFLL